MRAKDAAKWSASDWQTKVTFARPSGGGAVGVAFVWTTPNITINGKPAWDDENTCDFVIKPVAGSAAPTMMAEGVLSKVADAASPGTQGINASASESQAILAKLTTFKATPAYSARWTQVWSAYSNAQSFLLQDMQTGVKEMGSYYRQGNNLKMLIGDWAFMKNLGMLFVADAVIGNGDRLWKPNASNIMFKQSGQVVAIDSTTILTNFNAILNAPALPDTSTGPGGPRWGEFGGEKDDKNKDPKDWAKNQVSTKRWPDTEIGGIASSFSMQTLWDIDHWWTNVFRRHLEEGVTDPTRRPDENLWSYGKGHFIAGVQEGMDRVDKMFATKSWDWLKLKFNWYKNRKKYGDDPNMDWMNLKVRRKYYKARRAGKTQDEAEKEVLAYVEQKRASVMKP